MDHPTDPPEVVEALTTMDDTITRLLTQPSWAKQILTALAANLCTEDPFLVINATDLTATLDMVTELITGHLPLAVAEQAMQRAAAVLPERHYRETCDTYALRLLKAARNV